jgi:hypothetical protein
MRRAMLVSALLLSGVGAAGVSVDGPAADVPALVPAAANASARLLANPGFEAGLSSWTADTASAVEAVTSPVHGGGSAARLTDSSTTAGISLRGAPIAVLPGEEVTATAWTQRVAGTGGSLYLEFWRPDGVRASATSVAAGSATG